MVSFGEFLQQALIDSNINQAELARRSKLSPSQISKLLNDQSPPGTKALLAISDALRLPKETVFRAAGLMPPDADQTTQMDSVLEAMRDLPEEWQAKIAEDARRTREFYEAQAREERGPRRATGGAG